MDDKQDKIRSSETESSTKAEVPKVAENLIEIHDRVFDAYYGKMGESMMRSTQERVHWICRAVRGQRVLDVGCSQGIVPLLLGREGVEVVGVDLDAQAIDVASAQLKKEAPSTRGNISFVCTDFMAYSCSEKTFDSVVLSEVLEHLTRPREFVERAAMMLNADGCLVITLPFGVNDFIDHKKTYYLADAYRLLNEHFVVDKVINFGHWIGFCCTVRKKPSHDGCQDLPCSLVLESEKSFLGIEREYLKRIDDARTQLASTNAKFKAVMEEKVALVGKFKDLSEVNSRLSEDTKAVNARVRDAEARSVAMEKRLQSASKEIADLQTRHATAVKEVSSWEERATKAGHRAEVAEERIDELGAEVEAATSNASSWEERATKAGHRAEVAEERIDELGAEVEAATSNASSWEERATKAGHRAEVAEERIDELGAEVEAATSNASSWEERATKAGHRAEVAEERIGELEAKMIEASNQQKKYTASEMRLNRMLAKSREELAERSGYVRQLTEQLRCTVDDARTRQAVQSEMTDLVDELCVRCIHAEQELALMRISTKVRFGTLMATLWAHPIRIMRLPGDVVRLWRDWRIYRRQGPPVPSHATATSTLIDRIESVRKALSMEPLCEVPAEKGATSSRGGIQLFWSDHKIDGEPRAIDERSAMDEWLSLKDGELSITLLVESDARDGVFSFDVCASACEVALEVAYTGMFGDSHERAPSQATAYTVVCQGDGESLVVRLNVPEGAERLTMRFICEDAISLRNCVRIRWLQPGISVVMPTYKGEHTIGSTLKSLAEQKLDPAAFEVILVRNGPVDSTPQIVSEVQATYPDLNLHMVSIDEVGAGAARNAGIASATREFLTFVDDDDWITPAYLSSLVTASGYDELAVAQICDVKDGRDVPSSISRQIEKAFELDVVRPANVQSVLCMNAAKSLPTALAKQIDYDVSLKSGEDVQYFATLLTKFDLMIKVVPPTSGAVYRRRIRENSVSRQIESVDFSIKQRLDVIRSLRDLITLGASSEKRYYLQSVMRSQAHFIVRYLSSHMEDYELFLNEIRARNMTDMEFVSWLNGKLADTLVFSYCFAPYIDTAGVITAKRIRQHGAPVDVLSNRMDSVRKKDPALIQIASEYIGHSVALDTPTSFGNWAAIQQFADGARSEGERLAHARGSDYARIYSRAMWPGSHYAAAAFKAAHPEVHWTAEFSDPLWLDIEGKPRHGKLDRAWLDSLHVSRFARRIGVKVPKCSELFFWCEYLPYLMADELVFTNKNQLFYMMSYLEDETLREVVKKKSVISHHPTLPPSFYSNASASICFDEACFNIAYFGSFYKSRGLGDVLRAIKTLKRSGASSTLPVKLHVYTAQGESIRNDSEYSDIRENIAVHDLVGYFEFLALSTRFDCLVVSDAATIGFKEINPYLPSKISDYAGSGTDVWAIVEPGSVLDGMASRKAFKYVSRLGDVQSHERVLRQGIQNKRSVTAPIA